MHCLHPQVRWLLFGLAGRWHACTAASIPKIFLASTHLQPAASWISPLIMVKMAFANAWLYRQHQMDIPHFSWEQLSGSDQRCNIGVDIAGAQVLSHISKYLTNVTRSRVKASTGPPPPIRINTVKTHSCSKSCRSDHWGVNWVKNDMMDYGRFLLNKGFRVNRLTKWVLILSPPNEWVDGVFGSHLVSFPSVMISFKFPFTEVDRLSPDKPCDHLFWKYMMVSEAN